MTWQKLTLNINEKVAKMDILIFTAWVAPRPFAKNLPKYLFSRIFFGLKIARNTTAALGSFRNSTFKPSFFGNRKLRELNFAGGRITQKIQLNSYCDFDH